MSFYATQKHANRKDWRHAGKAARSCNPHGGCPYCRGNREHATRQRIESAEATREDGADD
jgi:hypothetical protein